MWCKLEFTPSEQGCVYSLAGWGGSLAAGQAADRRGSSPSLGWDGSSTQRMERFLDVQQKVFIYGLIQGMLPGVFGGKW